MDRERMRQRGAEAKATRGTPLLCLVGPQDWLVVRCTSRERGVWYSTRRIIGCSVVVVVAEVHGMICLGSGRDLGRKERSSGPRMAFNFIFSFQQPVLSNQSPQSVLLWEFLHAGKKCGTVLPPCFNYCTNQTVSNGTRKTSRYRAPTTLWLLPSTWRSALRHLL